ncbi:hypothetical protein MHF_1376 [Mycoplasma haemofelis Ohio2]|uniref:Uncharacterized protein n=1 Tax=Mycoplasma haemofelis (strain Ohio2) TaxID=859194 RepID=F6FGH4_MYCHI|nr:hypothetical protein MHF_1376 [Mycoplasma haemofelis Ohio2]
MKTTSAILTGTAATGGVVGGGVLANSLISKSASKETLGDYFNSKKLTLISSLEDSKEDKQWSEEFTLDQANIKKYDSKITDKEKLKNWCQDSLKLEKEKNKELIPHLEKWCVLGTIESRLLRSGSELIGDSEEAEWTKIYDKHTTSEDRAKVNLTGTKEQNTNNKTTDIQAIKQFCTNKKGGTFLAEEKASVYDVVIQWCTKDKSTGAVSPA